MKTIKIVFTKSKKKLPVASWIIRAYTWQGYSHVALEVGMQDWGSSYFQASEGKVHLSYNTEFYKKHEILKEYTLRVPKEIEYEIKKNIWQNAGKPYGMLQNIGIAWVDLCKFFGYKVANPFTSGQNCSELIARDVVMELVSGLDIQPDSIKPHEVEALIVQYLQEYVTDSKEYEPNSIF